MPPIKSVYLRINKCLAPLQLILPEISRHFLQNLVLFPIQETYFEQLEGLFEQLVVPECSHCLLDNVVLLVFEHVGFEGFEDF